MRNNRKIGDIAENIASDFLKQKGYILIHKNYQKRCGEIDIIVEKDDYIHFVEVKYRKNIKIGYPREAVTLSKQTKIKQTALHYIQEKNITDKGFSFDVLEIIDTDINYIENAFY